MMGLLFRQPNGLYGLYSPYVDGIICCNMTKEDYIDLRVKELKEKLEDMFAKEATSSLKDTLYADILSDDTVLKQIRYYNWNKEDLINNISMLRASGYSKKQCDEIEAKWNKCQKEIKEG